MNTVSVAVHVKGASKLRNEYMSEKNDVFKSLPTKTISFILEDKKNLFD